MTSEQIKAMLTRLYAEAVDGDNIGLVDQICHPEMIIHDPVVGQMQGAEAFKGLIGFFKGAFPGFRTEIHAIVVEGESAVIHHTHHCRHTGYFMDIPPTNNEVVVSGLELARFRDGKLSEWWRHDDDAGLLRQIGVLKLGAEVAG
jgi:predicted ester cyclase